MVFEGLSFGGKIKLMEIVDTSFKYYREVLHVWSGHISERQEIHAV